jgi:5-methyltetrahydropteroyltriglutamate--homocysteine methyltransferase
MRRSTDRILATHTGKLVMPDAGNTFMGPPPEVVADTIINFANVCGRENVIAGTDCGMRWHAQAAWAKYENIVRGAELASKRLWR